MITVNLDRSDGAKALYLQVYSAIKQAIMSNRLTCGQMLPSKKQLATHLQVSVKTIENAYYQLMLEGYIQSRERVGYFVGEFMRSGKYPSTPHESYVSKYREQSFRLDIKANKNPASLFPISVWNRLAREVMADKGTYLLETVPFNGVAELRIAIAHYLRDFRGMEVSPDQIIVGSGTEWLYRRITHLLGPQCIIGMEDPGYTHIKKILDNDGICVRSIPMDDAGMRVDAVRASDCTALHLSPMHHFPLGITMPVLRRTELLRWADADEGRYLIEDDYNSEFRYQGNLAQSLYDYDLNRKVIYLNTFSKTVAPSIRVAYMVLPERLMNRYLDTMSFYSGTVSSLLQYQLARFISDGHLERHIHRIRQNNVAARKLVADSVARSPLSSRIVIPQSSAGTHLIWRLDTARSDEELQAELFERGILASFVSDYCEQHQPALDGQLIVNYSRIDEAGLRVLLDALEEIL